MLVQKVKEGFLYLMVPALLLIMASTGSPHEVVEMPKVTIVEGPDSIEILLNNIQLLSEKLRQTDSLLSEMEKRPSTSKKEIASIKEAQKNIQGIEETSTYSVWMWYLKSREGFISHNYICPAGFNTIGYGHNLDACKHMSSCHHTKYTDGKTITYTNASKLLQEDIEGTYKQVSKDFPSLTRSQKYAVVGLGLNVGYYKLIYRNGKRSNGEAKFKRLIRQGRVPNFMEYTTFKTPRGKRVVSPNLVSARKFEVALYTGNQAALRKAAKRYKHITRERDILPALARGVY